MLKRCNLILILSITHLLSQDSGIIVNEEKYGEMYAYMLENPIYIGKVSLYHLMALPIISSNEAESLERWIHAQHKITQENFRDYLVQNNLPDELMYFFYFDRSFKIRSGTMMKLNNRLYSVSEKFRFSNRNWNVYVNTYNRENNAFRTFLGNFHRGKISIAVGQAGFSSLLGLLGSNFSFGVPYIRPRYEVNRSRPEWIKSGLYRNPDAVAIKWDDENYTVFGLIGTYHLRYHDEDGRPLLYAQPFRTAYASGNEKHFPLRVMQAGLWRKLGTTTSMYCQINKQAVIGGLVRDLAEGNQYPAPFPAIQNITTGIGVYHQSKLMHMVGEALLTHTGHFSGILELGVEPVRGIRWQMVQYKFSPRVYNLFSDSPYSVSMVPFNQAGRRFSFTVKYKIGMWNNYWAASWNLLHRISPDDFDHWQYATGRKKIHYELSRRGQSFQVEYGKYVHSENDLVNSDFKTLKLSYRNRTKIEYITFTTKMYWSSGWKEHNTVVNVQWKHSLNSRVKVCLGSVLFSVPLSVIPVYATEASSAYSVEYFRLSGDGVSCNGSLACKFGKSIVGMKVRRVRSRTRASPDVNKLFFNLYLKILLD